MVCIVTSRKKPKLKSPILLEGLPGIGFVANIAVLHLIRVLRAIPFAEVRCSSFQDFAITSENGQLKHPVNELYYYKGRKEERDLIILYGNTQALTSYGQYELCSHILDFCGELSCNSIVTLGGLKRDKKIVNPKLFFAATDKETAKRLLGLGVEIINGQIFGVAGLLIGLGQLRGFQGFSLLAETLGLYPDSAAAKTILSFIGKMFGLSINLDQLEETIEVTRGNLQSFGLLENPSDLKGKRESEFRWFV